MDIIKSYRTLELESGASLSDVRKAYKDMVRVWHPDRFAGNSRLRAKANEKLKEINIAYGEIKRYLEKDHKPHTDASGEIGAFSRHGLKKRTGLFIRQLLEIPFSVLGALLKNGRLKPFYSELMFSNYTLKKKPVGPRNRQNMNQYGSSGAGNHGNVKRKRFSEIMDEVAQSRKQRAKNGKASSKNKPC